MNPKSESTSLNISIDPQTVYISTNSKQVSYAPSIAVTVQNGSANTVYITKIAVTLPDTLAPYVSLGSITTVADPSELWDFGPSGVNQSEFDATAPVPGDAVVLKPNDVCQFSLLHVTLVSIITQSPVTVNVLVTFADDTTLSQPLTVNIKPTTASVSFSCMPATINPGETSVLSWDCTEIDYVIIDALGDKQWLPIYSEDVNPNYNTTYTLYAYGSGVLLEEQQTVTVGNPQVTFGAVDGITSVNYGSMLSLTWTCNQFTKSITITDNEGISIPDLFTNGNSVEQGTIIVGPIVTSTMFDLTAFGNTKENFVHAYQPIDIIDVSFSLTVTPDGDIWERDKVTFNWNIGSASKVSLTPEIDGGPSLNNLIGNVTIHPEDDVLYTFFVSGLKQNNPLEHTEKIQKNVSKVAINNFTLTPQVIEFDSFGGNSCTLTWDTDAELVTISNIGTVNTADSKIINAPADGTVYELAAGTTQNPGILTESFTIANVYGPYNFDSFKSDPGGAGALDLIVPKGGSMKLLAGAGNGVNYNLQLTGVTSPNDPHLNYIIGSCYYSADDKQPSFFIAIYDTLKQPDAPLYLQWADPNNQSGTITVTGTSP